MLGGVGIRKIDVSFVVINIDVSDIEKLVFKFMVDLFKVILGVWVESLGGEFGVNVFVCGFLGGGDVLFLMIVFENFFIYFVFMLFFFENFQLFCIDDIIEMVEGLCGGLNLVVSNG